MKLKKNRRILFLLSFSLLFAFGTFSYIRTQAKENEKKEAKNIKNYVKASVSQKLMANSELPEKLKYGDSELKIYYTIDEDLQESIERLLRRYPSDHTAIVIMDNETGNLLAFAGIDRKERRLNYVLPFTSTHPSASLFKLITTADLLENTRIDPSTKLFFNGRGTTLYKYQLRNKTSRWTRWISFQKAFAFSNNVIFGKAAINKLTGESLFKAAYKFGFNKKLMNDFNLGKSQIIMPQSQYELAEVASGFNKKTTISPIHASVMVSIVANKGIMRRPRLIKKIDYKGKTFKYSSNQEKILKEKSVKDLAQMMEFTVKKGTARGILNRRLGRRIKKKFIIGAKTGSITGGLPFGRHDWLSFYAYPKRKDEREIKYKKGISVAILNINEEKWYYKSSFLAQEVLKLYMKKLNNEKEAISYRASNSFQGS